MFPLTLYTPCLTSASVRQDNYTLQTEKHWNSFAYSDLHAHAHLVLPRKGQAGRGGCTPEVEKIGTFSAILTPYTLCLMSANVRQDSCTLQMTDTGTASPILTSVHMSAKILTSVHMSAKIRQGSCTPQAEKIDASPLIPTPDTPCLTPAKIRHGSRTLQALQTREQLSIF